LQGLESGKIKGEWLKLSKTLGGLQQLESGKERGRVQFYSNTPTDAMVWSKTRMKQNNKTKTIQK